MQREQDAADLALRLVYLMVNEAARCLEEKVVASPEDADYGMILGTGFAPLRGGPLRFADHFGIAKMVADAGDSRDGGKVRAVRFARDNTRRTARNFMKTPLDAPEKQIAEEAGCPSGQA